MISPFPLLLRRFIEFLPSNSPQPWLITADYYAYALVSGHSGRRFQGNVGWKMPTFLFWAWMEFLDKTYRGPNRNRDVIMAESSHSLGWRPILFFLSFAGCNETFTGLNGTFHSPNYPRNYPDGQYCSWRIAVRQSQRIHLNFTNFSLESDNNTDSLSVYDGENSTGEMLGVFYGGHPPPKEGIYSSSNQMLVIFKSDWSISLIGFRASYKAVNHSG